MDLKPIDRTDRALTRLNAALSIYRETILPEAQNPERQILYWIAYSKDTLAVATAHPPAAPLVAVEARAHERESGRSGENG
jgi:hypothetical protein